jgi:RNA polymerase sigma-70 factor (ECF subfamily)
MLTIAHRRAVDRVRSEQAASDRIRKAATSEVAYDDVVEQATTRIERQQVRRCIGNLTDLQREAVLLAYYRGYTYREVSEVLDTPLPTIKTRMRDGLIRLRDCLGVTT